MKNALRPWWIGVMLLVIGMILGGCSYTPAHIRSQPLIEIDGHHGGHVRRHGQNDQGEDDNAQ
ncbi:hypothetical protein [Halomonas organivorans]|uniref:Lipoprotein n=1 Tax=Halomonas organivorans TaxID=257772 RepID=A0A7W5BVD9_9GAMM|nr:hypothetical protein [Halomonas organivorans]MBB3139786.1 hypothetical protein [Halomonas organivorans]